MVCKLKEGFRYIGVIVCVNCYFSLHYYDHFGNGEMINTSFGKPIKAIVIVRNHGECRIIMEVKHADKILSQ